MRTVRRGKAVVLSLDTEDFSNPPRVEAAFEEVVKFLESRNVVVDMKAVTSLNSIGLSTITAGADVARSHKAKFALASVRPDIRRFLEKAGLARVEGEADAPEADCVEIAEDVEAALDQIPEGEDAGDPSSDE